MDVRIMTTLIVLAMMLLMTMAAMMMMMVRAMETAIVVRLSFHVQVLMLGHSGIGALLIGDLPNSGLCLVVELRRGLGEAF